MTVAATEPAPTPKQLPLSRRRKAAMIVQMLISDGNKLALSSLPETVQADLARELGEIRLVDRATVHAVASEFSDILASIGLSAPGGASAALAALSDHISPALARRLQAQIDARKGSDPWLRVTALDVEKQVKIFERESVEVGAIILSKLSVDRAADLLGRLPGDKARRITFAVSMTEKTSPATLHRIGQALVEDYCQSVEPAFEKRPVDRIGAILNSSPATTRNDLLSSLEGEDAEFARDVRKAIFTFADIPTRMVPTDIPGALRAVDPADLTTALAYALAQGGEAAEAAEHILANVSQRMAGQMREEAEELGPVATAPGEQALNKVSGAIRALADEGTIRLITEEDDTAA